MSIRLRAEFFFDDETNAWHYRVPALHINGGGTATREDAAGISRPQVGRS